MIMPNTQLILIAGPYRSGTGDDPDLMARNLAQLEEAAWPIFRAGHIPMIGEWVALPVLGLPAIVGPLAGHARGEHLGHRDLPHRILAVGEAPGRGVDERAGRLDLGRHLGELVADGLEAADRAPERVPLAGEGQRAV